MSGMMQRLLRGSFGARAGRALATVLVAAVTAGAPLATSPASAKDAAPAAATTPAQSFATPDAAFETFVAVVRDGDEAARRKLLGSHFRQFLPPPDADESAALRQKFLELYAAGHKVRMDGDAKAVLEVGTQGWTLPIPAVKGPDGWSFDVVAGAHEILVREIGRNEIAAAQAMLAIVDAQYEYAEMDPMKTGTVQYARRILSSPGKKDGLYWAEGAGDQESPLGELLAAAQADGANRDTGYNGYHFRLLYAQGPNAKGGAYDYIIKGRMVAGFAAIAWPVRYGETGVMTFIVNHDGVVYEKNLGPDTAAAAARIATFDPDSSWLKTEISP